MPPKKDTKDDPNSVAGFDGRETKLLAAAFLATTAPDKYDYELFATLTGNTAGSLKKMFPPVKRKAVEAHPSFAAFLGAPATGTGEETKAAPKAAAGRKRKAKSDSDDTEAGKELNPEISMDDVKTDSKKKAPAKGRGRGKKAKTEKAEAEAKEEAKDDGETAVEEDEEI